MQASVIISYYKNQRNLQIILHALNQQTAADTFEVIVSEDDDAGETVDFLRRMAAQYHFPIQHISQPDKGFQKCRALNKSVQAAKAPLLIFIDGDCMPHRKFVAEYLASAKQGTVLYGRRVQLSEKCTTQLLLQECPPTPNLLMLVATGCKRVEEGLYLPFVPQRFLARNANRLLGCNMGIYKIDLIAINGFDEDYDFPGGGEDSDIEWRLEATKKITFQSMKFRAIVYHIYHPERFTREMEIRNNTFLQQKINAGYFICNNGIVKSTK